MSLHCGLSARHIYSSLVLVQARKTHPYITERLLMGRKESNQKWLTLCIGETLIGYFHNSEDPDEMPQLNVVFHQDLPCLVGLKLSTGTEEHLNL